LDKKEALTKMIAAAKKKKLSVPFRLIEFSTVWKRKNDENRTERSLPLRKREKIQKMLFGQKGVTFPGVVLSAVVRGL